MMIDGILELRLHNNFGSTVFFRGLENYTINANQWHFVAFSFDSNMNQEYLVLDDRVSGWY